MNENSENLISVKPENYGFNSVLEMLYYNFDKFSDSEKANLRNLGLNPELYLSKQIEEAKIKQK